MLNKQLLKGVVYGAGYTFKSLAKEINMSENTMNSRVNGKSCFNISEIDAICRAIPEITNVQKIAIFLS